MQRSVEYKKVDDENIQLQNYPFSTQLQNRTFYGALGCFFAIAALFNMAPKQFDMIEYPSDRVGALIGGGLLIGGLSAFFTVPGLQFPMLLLLCASLAGMLTLAVSPKIINSIFLFFEIGSQLTYNQASIMRKVFAYLIATFAILATFSLAFFVSTLIVPIVLSVGSLVFATAIAAGISYGAAITFGFVIANPILTLGTTFVVLLPAIFIFRAARNQREKDILLPDILAFRNDWKKQQEQSSFGIQKKLTEIFLINYLAPYAKKVYQYLAGINKKTDYDDTLPAEDNLIRHIVIEGDLHQGYEVYRFIKKTDANDASIKGYLFTRPIIREDTAKYSPDILTSLPEIQVEVLNDAWEHTKEIQSIRNMPIFDTECRSLAHLKRCLHNGFEVIPVTKELMSFLKRDAPVLGSNSQYSVMD